MDFRNYLKEKLRSGDIIEFGPLNRPLFDKKEYKNISYADIRSTEEIKELYSGNDYLDKTGISIDIDSIVQIDYKIVDGSYTNTFKGRKFDVAYLSHVIEHMPDIISFFMDINKILKDNGRLVIIYPDKRYCFDHFRNSVSFKDAYATYKYGIKENARAAFDFSYNVIHENNPNFFWDGRNLIDVISKNSLTDAEEYYQKTLNGSITTDDVHFWPFSDIDFLKFIYEMKRADLFDYEIEEFYPTQENTQEFMIILKKSNKKELSNILNLINIYDTQTQENNYRTKIREQEFEIENIKNDYVRELQNYKNILNEKNKTMEQEQRKNNILCQENKILQLTNTQMDQTIKYLKEVIENYEKSKSWKITAPFRWIVSKIKK